MKVTRNTARLTGLMVASALALAACSNAPAETTSPGASTETADSADAAEPTQITLSGLAASATPWTYHVAQARDIFTDRGLEVEAVQAQNAPSVTQAVSTGTVEAGMTQADNVLSAIDEGASVKIIGAFMGRTWLRLFAAPGVESFDNVRGGTVSAGSTSGGTGNLLIYMLARHGVEPGDYGFLAVTNSADRITGMTNGQIQAGLLTPPYDSHIQAEGGSLLDWYEEPFSTYTLTVNTDWAADNPQAVQDLVSAFQEAQEWIFDPANKAELIDLIAETLDQSHDELEAAYDFLVGQEVLSPDFSVPEGGLEAIARISAEVEGEPFEGFDLSKYYTDEYLN